MSEIRGFHLHVYFEPEQQLQAATLRAELADRFALPVGRLHPRPVGPHGRPMFQALLTARQLAEVLSWLMLNRQGLNILLHPDTGQDRLDHSAHAVWLGTPQPLDLTQLN